MKKTIATVALILTACSFFSGVHAAAAVTETNKEVYGDATKIIQWADYTAWEEEGLAVYAGQWEGGGFSMFFDVSDGKEVNVKFKVPVYENESENNVTENGSVYTKYIVDMIVESFDNSGMAVLRLWGDSGKSVDSTNVAAKITCGDLHDKTPEEKPNEVADNVWVKGVMRENSEFDISFNTTDFFKAVWGDWTTEKASLLTASGTVENGQAVQESLNAKFNPEGNECKTVQVYFRLSAQCPYAECPVDGCVEHDPEAVSKMIITEVNGQSLANSDGVLVDNAAPFVAPVQIRVNKEINIKKEYSLEVKSSPRDLGKADFYCDYASDVVCYDRLTFSAKVVAPSGKETTYPTYDDFSKLVFEELGVHKISVTVTDEAGNSYTTPETQFEAVRGFLLSVEGYSDGDTIEGTVGKEIVLPAASATDKHGAECAVAVKVENPYGKEVELGEGNSFKPTAQGVYKVIYTSSSADGSASGTVTLRIAVRKAEKKSGCGSALTGSAFVLLSAAALGAALKRKNERG